MRATRFRLAFLSIALIASPQTSRAELIYATDGFRIVSFDSLTPNTATLPLSFLGLAANESIVGIDLRPSNGLIYGLGSQNHLYTINPLTGQLSQVGSSGLFSLSGGSFGVDFNPMPDRIRVVSDAEQNLRLNPNDGSLTMTDTPLSPAGNVVAAAYSNNFVGTSTTTLYGIDSTSGNLVLIGGLNGTPPPNGGAVTVVGSLGLSFLNNGLGFDISGLSEIAYACLSFVFPGRGEGELPQNGLYTINLSNGQATFVGRIGDGEFTYTGLTAATAVPEPSSFMLLGSAAVLFGVYRRFRRTKN